jgi:hypothetical protein
LEEFYSARTANPDYMFVAWLLYVKSLHCLIQAGEWPILRGILFSFLD